MNTYSEILAWSEAEKRPEWQRDALRRLLAGPLSPTDLAELLEECVGVHTPGSAIKTEPLTADHLPQQGNSSADVVLGGFHSICNVRLLAGEQALSFAPSGLNVVYGDNGSGKSSYARIMKRHAGARGADRPSSPEN